MKVKPAKYAGSLSIIFFLVVSFAFFSPAWGQEWGQGKALFNGKCARCHSRNGSGNPKMISLLHVPLERINLRRDKVVRMSVFQIGVVVDSGHRRMPTFRGKLTDKQIYQIAQYVKFLVGNVSEEDSGSAK